MKYDVSLQTIAWLNGRRNDHTLEISPKFQRRPVWLSQERSQLLATILDRLPFPEIYIHHQTNIEDGTERHIVVDGQQRVTSILKFIDGEVTLPDEAPWNGRAFADLSSDQKDEFWQYKIVVRGLSQTNDAEIRELFTKLNTNNIALNDQELRNARHKGRFKQLAERLADNPLFQSLALFTARDIRRMLDVEFASELVLLTVEGITNKKELLDDVYAEYEEDFPREAEYEEEMASAVGLLRTIINDANRAGAKRKSTFYSLFGACLRYFRQTGKTAFDNPQRIAESLSVLLATVQAGELDGQQEDVRTYFDAVTRAASDKGRRVQREDVLYRLIAGAEGLQRQIPLPMPD
jgi:hypothetical protein